MSTAVAKGTLCETCYEAGFKNIPATAKIDDGYYCARCAEGLPAVNRRLVSPRRFKYHPVLSPAIRHWHTFFRRVHAQPVDKVISLREVKNAHTAGMLVRRWAKRLGYKVFVSGESNRGGGPVYVSKSPLHNFNKSHGRAKVITKCRAVARVTRSNGNAELV